MDPGVPRRCGRLVAVNGWKVKALLFSEIKSKSTWINYFWRFFFHKIFPPQETIFTPTIKPTLSIACREPRAAHCVCVCVCVSLPFGTDVTAMPLGTWPKVCGCHKPISMGITTAKMVGQSQVLSSQWDMPSKENWFQIYGMQRRVFLMGEFFGVFIMWDPTQYLCFAVIPKRLDDKKPTTGLALLGTLDCLADHRSVSGDRGICTS